MHENDFDYRHASKDVKRMRNRIVDAESIHGTGRISSKFYGSVAEWIESTCLETRSRLKTAVGSNPTASAILCLAPDLR
jgi:hypothetical protein